MWCEAYGDPDAFWRQTPHTFQLAMKAARNRSEANADMATATAHQTASFGLEGQSKRGLRPLKFYLPKRVKPAMQSSSQMLSNMKLIAHRVNRQYKDSADG